MEVKNITSESIKIVKLGNEIVLFEKGWWMERRDYDKQWERESSGLYFRGDKWGFNRDNETKKLTPYLLP